MNCQEFEDRLQLVLDERCSPERDERLTEHARSCANCRETMQAQEALLEALRKSRQTPSGRWAKNVAADVVAAAVVEKQADRRRWNVDLRWVSVGLVGVAAAVILMFSSAWRAMTGPREVGGSHTVQNAEPAKKNANDGQLAIARPLVPREKAGPKVVSPAPVPSASLNEYQLVLQQWVQTLPDSVDVNQLESSPGIRPLASSIGLAIDTLRRTLPGRRDDMQTHQRPAGASYLGLPLPGLT